MVGRIIAWVAGLLLIGLYASAAVAAVGNAIMLPEMAGSLGLGISVSGWFWLVFGIALPVFVLALALLLGRGRTAAMRVLLLAAGIGLVAAVQLEVLHLVPQSSFFA